MPIRLREENDVHILDIDGRVDINSSEIVEMVGWLVNSGKLKIIFNFENVDIVDYNGLSILAISYKNIVNHKGRLKLLNVPLSVVEMLKVVKLDSVFELYTDEETAINSFSESEALKLHLRRKFPRLDIHLNVRYKMVADTKSAKVFEGKVLNISGAGIYIYTPHTFPMGTLLDLQFNIPGSSAVLETTGRVSWLADKDLQSHAYPGMGVSFSHLTAEKERAIIDFIDKNVTHRADQADE
ncbi:MAG: PilZ domain-containing protein [Candidatus Omnitrophica bacterium]|nr:PilZ domain-containing protein [Candidatus Omnitrophota bacterium]MDD5437088.1 PilZ domain-containing protein [Candidatus Omnitrophota bacterium]